MAESFVLRETSVPSAAGPVDVPVLVCAPLEKAGFRNAFSTRWGGVSDMPASALHLSFNNEEASRVRENRRRFLVAMGAPQKLLVTAKQVHSDIRIVIDTPMADEPEGDALLSRKPDLVLAVKTADCVPVLIGDPTSGAFAAIHAGWRGTLSSVVEKTALDLKEKFGANLKRCVAAIGPAACGPCYEVGPDVATPVQAQYGDCSDALLSDGNRYNLDVAALNVLQLVSAGLEPANIHRAAHCTIHENHLFFSHRAEAGAAGNRVGRMGSAIARKS